MREVQNGLYGNSPRARSWENISTSMSANADYAGASNDPVHSDLPSRIKLFAREAGFDLCGIARVGEFRELEAFPPWIATGQHGEMKYLEARDDAGELKRASLARVAPWARSVIVCAVNYNTANPYSTQGSDPGRGWISRYAWSAEDYHDAVLRRLREVEGRVTQALGADGETSGPEARPAIGSGGATQEAAGAAKKSPAGAKARVTLNGLTTQLMLCPPESCLAESFSVTAKTVSSHPQVTEAGPTDSRTFSDIRQPPTTNHFFRSYVDTGPLVERVYAKYAGIGWIAKNTCVINQQLGSWLFLGVILTSLELDADMPAPDRCGSCTRCIDACPTHAFLEPGHLDARLCISYLTIEKRGEIPGELRAGIGRHVFGCDICQDVCPWNRKAPVTAMPEFQAREGLVNPALDWLAEMEQEEFGKVFRGSPVRRTKRTGLRRNAVIAMGNSGDAKFLPTLRCLADDSDAVVAGHAQWALAKLSEKNARAGGC